MPQSKRRRFGKLQYKPNKAHPTHIEASFPTPVSALEEYPGLPLRQLRTFPLDREGEAVAWLDRAQKRVAAGVWEPEKVVRREELARTMTIGEYAPIWLEERRTPAGNPLKGQTVYKIQSDLKNHVLPFFSGVRLVDVDQRMVDKWLDTLPPEQESMRFNALKVLKAIMRSAAKPGERGEPPLVPRNLVTRSLSQPERKSRTVPASPEQVKVIYDTMPTRYAMAVYLAVFGEGLRIGEVCALQRGDIDLDNRVIFVRRARMTQGKKVIDTPKSKKSVRDEVIPEQLVPLLTEFLGTVGEEEDAWLFHSVRAPGKPVHPNTVRGWYEKARAEAGRPDLRFHDLRHTGLTWLAQEGATTRELMDAAGHADVEMAMRYQHSVDDRRQALAQKLGSRLLPDDTPESLSARIEQVREQIEKLEDVERELQQRLRELDSEGDQAAGA